MDADTPYPANVAPTYGIAASPNWLQRWSRKMLEDQLAGITTGWLRIQQAGRVREFGTPAERAGAVSDELSAVVRVHDPRFYTDAALGGSIGAAESFMRGYWSCDDLTALLRLLLINFDALAGEHAWTRVFKQPARKLMHWLRRNSARGSQLNISKHYDLGNELFSLFLDDSMMYSCALFTGADCSLHEAQIAKLDRICKKLQLTPSDHLLEIGTGWGGLAIHAARHYGCRITTTTISPSQYRLALQRVAEAGLTDRVDVICEDYRNLTGQYDKLVSIEMIEAVGHAFLDSYFSACSRLLKPHGQMLIQAITLQDQLHDAYLKTVDFIQQYIFPGGCLPALSSLAAAVKRGSDLQLFHLEDWTPHYAHTLRLWRDRFLECSDQVLALGMPDWFVRMWDFYFCYCEAAFLERRTQLVQIMYCKPQSRPIGLDALDALADLPATSDIWPLSCSSI